MAVTDDEEPGEFYTDTISGQRRRKRGKRKVRMGPYSLAEKNMVRAFQYAMAALHHMDGELAELVARRYTAQFVLDKATFERYSYNNLPDPQPEDWQELREEMGLNRTAESDAPVRRVQTEYRVVMVNPDDDGNDGLDGLRLFARVGDRANGSILLAGVRAKILLTTAPCEKLGFQAKNESGFGLDIKPIMRLIHSR